MILGVIVGWGLVVCGVVVDVHIFWIFVVGAVGRVWIVRLI